MEEIQASAVPLPKKVVSRTDKLADSLKANLRRRKEQAAQRLATSSIVPKPENNSQDQVKIE